MTILKRPNSRRQFLKSLGIGSAVALARMWPAFDDIRAGAVFHTVLDFTGPGANSYWNSVGPLVAEPQKSPLILLTDRPVQLETPRHYFLNQFTPNDAFYVRWHLETLPNSVDLKEWRLAR